MNHLRPSHIVSNIGYAIESAIALKGVDALDISLIKVSSVNAKNDSILVGLGFLVDIEEIEGFEPTQVLGRLTLEFYACDYEDDTQSWLSGGFYKTSEDMSRNAVYWGDGDLSTFEAEFGRVRQERIESEQIYNQELMAAVGHYIKIDEQTASDIFNVAVSGFGICA